MSLRLPAPSPLNGQGLLEELQTAGLPCHGVVLVGDVVELAGLDDTHTAHATLVVAVHAGAGPLVDRDAAEAQAEIAEMRDRARQVLSKARRVVKGEDTFTAAEIQRIVAALVVYLARSR